jgi:hypothetical protein
LFQKQVEVRIKKPKKLNIVEQTPNQNLLSENDTMNVVIQTNQKCIESVIVVETKSDKQHCLSQNKVKLH